MAQLSYFYFSTVEKLPFELECTTIGSPKVGCEHYCREFAHISKNSPITKYGRFVNTDERGRDDLFTCLPPLYKHALNCQRITVMDDEVLVDDSCSSINLNSITTSFRKTHDSEEYFRLIERYLFQQPEKDTDENANYDAAEENKFNNDELGPRSDKS